MRCPTPEALPPGYQVLAFHRTDLLDPIEAMTLGHVPPAGVAQRLPRSARRCAQNHGRALRPPRLDSARSLRAEPSELSKEMNHVPHFKAVEPGLMRFLYRVSAHVMGRISTLEAFPTFPVIAGGSETEAEP